MAREYLEWHSHEVRTELSHSPDNGQALQFGGGIGLLSLVEGPRSAADDTLFAIADLSQDCAEACGQRIGIQPEGLAEVREGSDGAGREERLEAVEGGLAVGAPMEDRVFPGQSMQGTCDGCEVLHISLVVTGETKERADFGGCFGRQDFPNSHEERRVWQEALFRHPLTQVTDLFCGKSAFLGPQLEVSVPESLKTLSEPSEMFLPCRGKEDDVVQIKQARFPVEAREDALHEAGEGSRSVAETKWDMVELVQLPTASTKRCLLLIPLHNWDLPVPTLQVEGGEPASPVKCIEEVVNPG